MSEIKDNDLILMINHVLLEMKVTAAYCQLENQLAVGCNTKLANLCKAKLIRTISSKTGKTIKLNVLEILTNMLTMKINLFHHNLC